MSDDLLDRSTRALRDATAPHDTGADALLARIERARVPARRASQRWRAGVWAAAATLSVFGAWAGVTGRVPLLGSGPSVGTAPSPSDERAPPAQKRAGEPVAAMPRVAPSAAAPAVEPLASAPASTTGNGVSAPGAATRERAEPRSPARRSTTPGAGAAAGVVAAARGADDLYREAHRAHFQQRDWAAALAGWDRYLAAAGRGAPLALEARYNRAIALARLGQRESAIAALSAFASGEYGGYRREEAQRLIRALEQPANH